MRNNVKTRIAPSPTGPLHIGTARTALFNFLFSKKNKGDFLLRIEDTDLKRSDPKFEKNIKEGLEWLNIKWDDFHRQSERKDLYKKYIKELLSKKMAFKCFHSQKELEQERKEQIQNKQAPRHVCSYREGRGKSANKKSIIRFKNDFKEKIIFNDLIRGQLTFEAPLLGDFALAKDINTPLYNFAVVIDDNDAGITHIIRGEDHISNTPKQLLIQNALGFERMEYAHLPLILGKDRAKLSKRHGATSITEYKQMGYLPEALINYMALLGWNPGDEKELFSLQELINEFSLKRVQKSGAIFNIEKLNWLNQEYIKKEKTKMLAQKTAEYIKNKNWQQKIKKNPEFWLSIIALEKERMTTLSDLNEKIDYFFEEPKYDKSLLAWKNRQNSESILRHLDKLENLISDFKATDFQKKSLEEKIMPYANEKGRGEVLWPLRVALSGKSASPGPFEIAEILGKKETLKRIKKARNMLL